MLREMGDKLLTLGLAVHEWNFDTTVQQRNLDRLATVTAERKLEVDARRLFVKTWCSLLEEQARSGEREFSAEALNDLVQGAYESFRQRDQANVDELG
jgi:hypothetical protein